MVQHQFSLVFNSKKKSRVTLLFDPEEDYQHIFRMLLIIYV